MGIPYYFYVLMKNYPDILHVTTPDGCTDFFMDFNGAIHHVANGVLEEGVNDTTGSIDDRILEKTWDYVMSCTGTVSPCRMVHICTDGVAPIAKLYQQRKRRFISAWKNKRTPVPYTWDRNAISPGTPFMARLHAHMMQQIRDREKHNGIHFYFSSSDEAGEGEHKIMARIANLHSTNSKVIIHGLDADLIMLSLISHKPDIYLMREPSGAYKDMKTQDGFMYVSIDKLRRAMLHDLRVKYGWAVTDDMLQDPYCHSARIMIESYVVICSLLGNDFLPHPLTLSLKKNGHEQLMFAAKHAWEAGLELILPNYNINFKFVAHILTTLSQTEDGDLWKLNEEYMKRKPFENEDDPLDPYPLIHKDELCRVIYRNRNTKWRTFYYKHMFYSKMHDTSVISNACHIFMQGLLWVYRYYTRQPKDASWYYPYNYAPSLRDLVNYMTGLTTEEETQLTSKFITAHSNGFLHPHAQLLCIMPPESLAILPKRVQEIMTSDAYGCGYMFPIDFHLQTYMKTHLWECTPVLPQLDIDGIIRAVGKSV
jgi:5'-3' exoribonuclease 1